MAGFRCRQPGCEEREPFASLALVRAHNQTEHAKKAPPKPASSSSSSGPPPPAADDDGEVAPQIPTDIDAELEPRAPRRTFREWMFGFRKPAPRPGERAPKRKREYTGDIIGTVWGGLGSSMIRTGFDVPLGRTLIYQQAVAGELIDNTIADSALDRRILQPIARNRDNAEALAALVTLPALVYIYERASAEVRSVLGPWMEEAVRAHIVAMLPVIRKKQARDRELAKVVAEAKAEGFIDPNIGDAQDVVVTVLDGIFSGIDLTADEPVDGEVIIPEEVA